mmetsp:Transcript_30567/g.77994  ORF Transcript_30567/g.77994 Transcript_30567/m.77994 type:complete len:235 (+) Transcript_30567:880-1584(+)
MSAAPCHVWSHTTAHCRTRSRPLPRSLACCNRLAAPSPAAGWRCCRCARAAGAAAGGCCCGLCSGGCCSSGRLLGLGRLLALPAFLGPGCVVKEPAHVLGAGLVVGDAWRHVARAPPRAHRDAQELEARHRVVRCVQQRVERGLERRGLVRGPHVRDVQEALRGRLPGQRVQLLVRQRLGVLPQRLLQALREALRVLVDEAVGEALKEAVGGVVSAHHPLAHGQGLSSGGGHHV